MDASKLSASEEVQHLTNSSGSSLSSPTSASYPSQYSDVDGLPKIHVLKTDNDEKFNGGRGDGSDGGSETEGFVSGEEDFDSERAFVRGLDKEIVVKAIAGEEDSPVKFVNSSEFFYPSSQRPIAKVSVDDDDGEEDDGDSKYDVLGAEDVVRESFVTDRDLKTVGGESSVENLGTNGEILVDTGLGKNANFGELVKENGVSGGQGHVLDALVGGEVDKELDNSKFVEGVGSVVEGSSVPETQLEMTEIENKKAVESKEGDVLNGTSEVEIESKENGGVVEEDSTVLGGVDEKENSLIVELADDKLAEKDGVDSESDRVAVAESGNVEVHGQKDVVAGADEVGFEKRPEREDELKSDSETRQKGLTTELDTDEVEVVSGDEPFVGDGAESQSVNCASDLAQHEPADEARPDNSNFGVHDLVDELEAAVSVKSLAPEFVEPSSTNQEIKLEEEVQKKHFPDEGGNESVNANSILDREIKVETEDDDNDLQDNDKDLQDDDDDDDDKDLQDDEGENEGSIADGNNEGMIFGSSEAAKQFLEELERGSDSDEEVDTDEEGGGKELFDAASLAALLKASTAAPSDGGNVTITTPDGSRLFSIERPAGLGSSIRSLKPASRPNNSNLFTSSNVTVGGESENLSDEEKAKLEKFQQIRVQFLRLVQRLGVSTEDSVARQVLYRLALLSGRQNSREFSPDAAKMTALQLEAEGKDDLNFSLNILVLGKTGVGKSATINSIFGEEKTPIYAFGPATTTVKEIVGVVDGVKIRVFDTPGLKSAAMEQNVNRKILSLVQKFTKKCAPDIVLYVDRLDTRSRDLNDVPLLRSITSAFGPSIWRSTIVTLTHGASAPPDGPLGSPLNYELFVAQRSQILQQTIGQAVGELRFMSPSMMSPICLVENHHSCRKNRDGQKVLPNGQSWRPKLLLLSYSMKILSEATNLSKPQESFDNRKLFGFRSRSPPLPYLLNWLLQPRPHPKLSSDQENADSDIDLDDLSDSDQEEEEDEYDQLPSFKPLKKAQIAKLSKEQRKAYTEEYDYRVKLLQKKLWREELRRMKEMKKKGKVGADDYGYLGEEDPENGGPAAVPVPLPDLVLPPSFDSENPAYRYRLLEPTSQFSARPVLGVQGWDHDCGYDSVNLEHSLAVANSFPAAVTVQLTKDKKDFTMHLDSSVAAKHGENGSSMAGFDIQNIGKQFAYIVRGDTKFKNFKRNKTGAGVAVTFLGESVSTGLKVEDQIALGKRVILVGTAGTVRSQGESVHGANFEVRLREADYPIGQDQSSVGLSLVKFRGDLALMVNLVSQFSLGRNYKMTVRAGVNNKLSGQISVRTSSSEQLQIALVAVLPIVRAICNTIWPSASENYSIY
ncbi:PREDICTED: translocase of chloroplast 159, chloroplastic-like isoform X1 [Prunus mume]|uniref:Translocase of chloroplast 159, chloroplastic-like isoform X1 n=1 Tax=Prunus mume TaxID=102107 RepID=A0ABM1LTS3_PRUMU|nr:PREDICTED: translocase of chloroplast 159, chloroplastic-like isoform X1 [Prunus mume]